jgi:hypothetical protein
MPYVNKPRPYAKEYKNYDGTEAVKKKRECRGLPPCITLLLP